MLVHKVSQLENVKILDGQEGIVEAFVNSMGQPDSDGDIIVPSAFDSSIQQNMPVTVLLGHDPSKVVGKVLEAHAIHFGDSAKLYNKIQFNLDTQLGRETFSNVAGGFIKEWSVGFNIPDGGSGFETEGASTYRVIKDLDWVEVSSVIRGASRQPATLSAKSPIPYEATATTDDPWDGPATIASIPNDSTADTLREYYAYVETGANPDAKSSYRFIHHEHPSGEANLRACSSAIAVLNGGRGGTTIPEDQIRGVYNHLRRHLEAADREAPELKIDIEDDERRRREYQESGHQHKEAIEHAPVLSADDEQPIISEAYVPSTDEARRQVEEALERYRARSIGFRLRKRND